MCNRDGPDVICVAVSALSLVSSGLVDQQLDQGAGIEVEAQRRPSATQSEALLPLPLSFTGLGM